MDFKGSDTLMRLYEKYSGELYGILCQLTSGEPKQIVRGCFDKGYQQDGFKALVDLNKRYDATTAASLLLAYLEVVNPPAFSVGIHRWEARVGVLANRHQQVLYDNVKLALFIGMLPKEYQDLAWQQSAN